MTARGAAFATITHAAGISSTGDPLLDALLPFDEPYRIPAYTAEAIEKTHAHGGRIIAIGTTVVRALEHSAGRPGPGMATNRIGPGTRLQVVDAILSGTHEPGTSHHDLLRAFVGDATLSRIDHELESNSYHTHEFGDSVFLTMEGASRGARADAPSAHSPILIF
jgi:S-adenosylmethionine:tRNA ribosyltransferase-isomerase